MKQLNLLTLPEPVEGQGFDKLSRRTQPIPTTLPEPVEGLGQRTEGGK